MCSSDLFDQLFAKVFTLEQTQKRLWCSGQSLGHSFAGFEFAGGNQRTQFFQGIGPDFHVFADNEALNLQAAGQNQRRVAQGHGPAVIARNHAAQGDAAKSIHAWQNGVQHHAADVFKVTVHAIGTLRLDGF